MTIVTFLLTNIVGDSPAGTGLIFIAVAETVQDFPGSFILSILFFFMVITLGLGSMIGTAEGVITPVYDLLHKKGFKVKKPVLVAILSIGKVASQTKDL